MDEYDRGMSAEVKTYFRKIMNSFGAGLLWLMVMGIAGFYFKLAIIKSGWGWYNIVFYLLAAASMFWLLFFFYKTWKSTKPFHH